MAAIEDNMLSIYGCLPPWVNKNKVSLLCEESLDVKTNASDVEYYMDDIVELLANGNPTFLASCLPPCVSNNIKFETLASGQLTNSPLGMIRFNVAEKVTVLTDIYSYDGSSLIVDFGSLLGLWLGLSVISFLDLGIEVGQIMRQGCKVFK